MTTSQSEDHGIKHHTPKTYSRNDRAGRCWHSACWGRAGGEAVQRHRDHRHLSQFASTLPQRLVAGLSVEARTVDARVVRILRDQPRTSDQQEKKQLHGPGRVPHFGNARAVTTMVSDAMRRMGSRCKKEGLDSAHEELAAEDFTGEENPAASDPLMLLEVHVFQLSSFSIVHVLMVLYLLFQYFQQEHQHRIF